MHTVRERVSPYAAVPGLAHAMVTAELIRQLGNHVSIHRLGQICARIGFLTDSTGGDILVADIAFVRAAGEGWGQPQDGLLDVVPRLVVKVVSPDDLYVDVEDTVLGWLNAGCGMVVVVNPCCRAAKVYRSPGDVRLLTANDSIDGGDVVPGWELPLRQLFG